MQLMKRMAVLGQVMALSASATTISLFGIVKDSVTGNGLSGVKVSLAKGGLSPTTTLSNGSWTLSGVVTGIAGRHGTTAVSGTSHLSVQDGHVLLRYEGHDLLGHSQPVASVAMSPATALARSSSVALDTIDTLLFSWQGTVRLRKPITSYEQSEIATVLDTSSAGPGMKLIPAGTFTMGSPTTEVNRSTNETQHSVTLSSFYMDSTDVTRGQYLAVMGVNPSSFSTCGTTCPVENVTWFDAVLYCNARSKKAGLDTVYSYTALTGTYGNGVTALTGIAADLSKSGYRLPTEAQWEYAARGGTTTAYYWGDDTATATVSKYAWYTTNASNTTHPVATKLPNVYGLYDMAGNVWQWTNDWYGTYSTTSATDPSGPSSGTSRVLRGGSWHGGAYLRSAYRGSCGSVFRGIGYGFRSVRPGS